MFKDNICPDQSAVSATNGNSVYFRWSVGDKLRDKVSGLVGVVMVRAEYATGCHHYGLSQTSTKQDGTLHEWEWLDQSRLELVEAGAVSFRNAGDPRTSGAFPSGPGR